MSKVYLNAPLLHSTIVAWVMGILICISLLFSPKKYTIKYQGSQAWLDKPDDTSYPLLRTDIILPQVITILIIGGLLIYTLRNK